MSSLNSLRLSQFVANHEAADSKSFLIELHSTLSTIKGKANLEDNLTTEWVFSRFSESVQRKANRSNQDDFIGLGQLWAKDSLIEGQFSSFKTFQEMKRVILDEPDTRLGMSNNESKTLDPSEISDDIPVMANMRTLVQELIELWQDDRQAILSTVEKASYPFTEEAATAGRIDLLFWGVEVGLFSI